MTKKFMLLFLCLSVLTIFVTPTAFAYDTIASSSTEASNVDSSETNEPLDSGSNSKGKTSSQTLNSTSDSTVITSDSLKEEKENLNYYEPSPNERSDLNVKNSNVYNARTIIDNVIAGELNRPSSDFIDVSSHNGVITVAQYQMMKNYGIRGVVVKLTEGTTYFNPEAQTQVKNAQIAGLKVSAYHYSHYTSNSGAEAEAAFFASKAKQVGLSNTTVMVSDIEEPALRTVNVNSHTLSFKKKLNDSGYENVAYYLSRSWLDVANGVFQTSVFGKNNIWVAQYPYTPTAAQKWNSDYSSWQWSSNFYFPGIAHPFDINMDYNGLFTEQNQWDGSEPVSASTSVTDIDNKETTFQAVANVSSGKYTPYKVYFATWSEKNGQDDLIWYEGVNNGNNIWSTKIEINNHRTSGNYIVHTYVQMNGTEASKFHTGTNNFFVSQPISDGHINSVNVGNGIFEVIVKPSSKAEIDKVKVPIWSTSGQADIKWYDGERQLDGTYKVTADVSNHNYNTGKYTVHAYVYTKNGLSSAKSLGSVEVKLNELSAKTTITDMDSKETTYRINSVISMGGYGKDSTVLSAVWSLKGGQDDLVWYEAKKQADNTYISDVNINNHKTAGTYNVHTYIRLKNGTMKILNSSSFSVKQPKVSGEIGTVDTSTGTFEVNLKVSSKADVDMLRVPIWSQSGQKDIKWYDAVRQSNGIYKVIANISNHNYNVGTYTVHVYLYTKNSLNTAASLGNVNVDLDDLSAKTTISDINGKETNYLLSSNVSLGIYGENSKVMFAVWGELNGQNDLRWYTATKQQDGTYATSIDINNHKESGKYSVHTYLKLKNGTMKMLANNSFLINKIGVSGSFQKVNNNAGTFDVVVTPNSKADIDRIMVATWTKENQKDLKWFKVLNQSEGKYLLTVNANDFQNRGSDFKVHVYMYSKNGLSTATNLGSITLKK